MTGEEMKTFATGLLDGDIIDDDVFYTMAEAVKTIVEDLRPWRQLVKTDSSKYLETSDTYLTMKDLPSDWMQYEQYNPMTLVAVDDSSDIKKLTGSNFAERLQNKNSNGLFYVDLANNDFAIINPVNRRYQIHQFYISVSATITSSTSWVFPTRYHAIIPYMVVGMYKGGVDYDDIFARMAPENRAVAQSLISSMELWDDKMQRQENDY